MPKKLPPLPGDPADNCNAFLTRCIEWCKASGIPVEVIERQLLATAAGSYAVRNGAEATARWLHTAAEKVELHKPPAGSA